MAVATPPSPDLSPPTLKNGATRLYTPEEYLALEETADVRHEYRDGEIVEMPGATARHNDLVSNLVFALMRALRQTEYRVRSTDTRVRVTLAGLYTYPDVVVVNGVGVFDGIMLLDPCAISEVLSDSTETYDRGDKFRRYQQLDSLTDYVLVSQNIPRIEHYTRQSEGRWLLSSAEGLENSLTIGSLGVTLVLADVYDKIDWPGEAHSLTPEDSPAAP